MSLRSNNKQRRTMILTLVGKENLSENTVILTFQTEESVNFIPGQFFTFLFQGEGKKVPRSYSVLRTKDNTINFMVRYIEDGFASKIFQDAKINDEFTAMGPFGEFVIDKDAKRNIFVATNTGVAPFYAMIKDNVESPTLVFGARTQDQLFFRDYFENRKDLIYIPTLSREDWDGKTGYVQEHVPIDPSATYYICGKPEMVSDTVKHLKEQGVKDIDIKVEKYESPKI